MSASDHESHPAFSFMTIEVYRSVVVLVGRVYGEQRHEKRAVLLVERYGYHRASTLQM